MATAAYVPDAEGLRTLKVDLTAARGVAVVGRIVDRTSGKGVPGQVRSAPLPDNKYWNKPGYDLYRYNPLGTPTDAQGRFRIVVIPGPSVLLVQAAAVERMRDGVRLNPFTQPQLSDEDRKRVSLRGDTVGGELLRTANDREVSLPQYNACRVLDLAEDAGPVRRDVFVERGQTRTVHLEDANGKPLSGCWAGGLTDRHWPTFTLKKASCTVYGLRAKKERQLAFVHPERRLAGLLTLRGDEKGTPTVRLLPTGSIIGRVLDADGQPLAGVLVRTDTFGNEVARSVDAQLGWRREPILTDSDGRFRIEGVIPDLEHPFILSKGKTYLALDPPLGRAKVKSGQTLDLGDIRVKPGP